MMVLADGTIWAVMRAVQEDREFSARVAIDVSGGCAGPVVITGWAEGRCLGAWKAIAGGDEAYFAGKKPGPIQLKWHWPDRPADQQQIVVEDASVRVLLKPNQAAGTNCSESAEQDASVR